MLFLCLPVLLHLENTFKFTEPGRDEFTVLREKGGTFQELSPVTGPGLGTIISALQAMPTLRPRTDEDSSTVKPVNPVKSSVAFFPLLGGSGKQNIYTCFPSPCVLIYEIRRVRSYRCV